jgi:hypothetical protein
VDCYTFTSGEVLETVPVGRVISCLLETSSTACTTMDIADIPNQIAKTFKYSLRSSGAFILSLITAFVVFAVAYDLIYGFWYARWYNTEHANYGRLYFIGLLLVSVVLPLTIGAGAYLRARASARPFKPEQIGIAIAPFDVISVDPETLGTANTLHSLDIVSTQFFRLVQSTLRDYPVAEELKFRFLPQYTKITNKEAASRQLARLNAALVFWGHIIQRRHQPMEIDFEMQGTTQAHTFSHMMIERFPMLPLQYLTFLEAARALEKRGETDRARRWHEQARLLREQILKDHPEAGNALA